MNTYSFKGRGAAVTGGASGIDLAVVARLLVGGAAVEAWKLFRRPSSRP